MSENEQEVVCLVCGKEHDRDSETFFTIVGNVYIGRTGGIVGNNFCNPEDPCKEWDISGMNIVDIGQKMRKTYVCRKARCLLDLIPLND